MRRSVVASVLVMLGVSCSHWEGVPHKFPGDVGDGIEHRKWTRSTRVYNNLETVALISVTLLSNEAQRQLAQAVGRDAPGRNKSDFIGFDLPQARASALIVVASSERDWQRLDPPRAPWTVSMEVDGTSMAPEDIRPVFPKSTFERFFPSWNPWSRAWLVRFPVSTDAMTSAVSITFMAPGDIRGQVHWP